QHENDHLDGILYLSRMADLSRIGFTEELARVAAEAQAQAQAQAQARDGQ
ncbi:MAG TPA: peptide deformylase, partial [Roseomonas sp.]